MQTDHLRHTEPLIMVHAKLDAPKRRAVGLQTELGLCANGKALRHDRHETWDNDEARAFTPRTWQ